MEKLFRNRYAICTWGLAAFFSVLYISLIFNNNVLTDEAFTMQLLGYDFPGIIAGTARDVHPPLYYLIAKTAWYIFGRSLTVQKVVTIIPMVMTLLLGPLKLGKLFDDKTAFWYVLMLACLPCTMEFAVQVRMYSLALFFVTLCGISAYEAFVSDKNLSWFTLALSGLGAGYSHYFALLAVVELNGFLLIAILYRLFFDHIDSPGLNMGESRYSRLIKWGIASIVMILGYIPWFPTLMKQMDGVTQSYWIPEITATTLWDYQVWAFGLNDFPFTTFVFLFLLAAALFTGITGIFGYKNGRPMHDTPTGPPLDVGNVFPHEVTRSSRISQLEHREYVYGLLCLLLPFMVTSVGLLFSALTRPVYRDQYILPSIGILCIFFAITMRRHSPRLMIPVLVFLLFVGAIQYKENFRQEYRSTYVPRLEEYFRQENLTPNDCIIYNYKVIGFIYKYYFPDNEVIYMEDWNTDMGYERCYFFVSPGEPVFDLMQIYTEGYSADPAGHFGIEQHEFDILKMTYTPPEQ